MRRAKWSGSSTVADRMVVTSTPHRAGVASHWAWSVIRASRVTSPIS